MPSPDGEAPDATVRLGDCLANAGEYNRRHNAVLRAVHKAVAAVAVGACVLGDKEDLDKTAMLNADHAVDLAELGGDGTFTSYSWSPPLARSSG